MDDQWNLLKYLDKVWIPHVVNIVCYAWLESLKRSIKSIKDPYSEGLIHIISQIVLYMYLCKELDWNRSLWYVLGLFIWACWNNLWQMWEILAMKNQLKTARQRRGTYWMMFLVLHKWGHWLMLTLSHLMVSCALHNFAAAVWFQQLLAKFTYMLKSLNIWQANNALITAIKTLKTWTGIEYTCFIEYHHASHSLRPRPCPHGLALSGSGKPGYLRRPYRVPPQLSQVSCTLDLFTALAAAVEKWSPSLKPSSMLDYGYIQGCWIFFLLGGRCKTPRWGFSERSHSCVSLETWGGASEKADGM